jgi:hypothetical protein
MNKQPPPLPPTRTAKPQELETIEYETTVSFDVPPHVLKPIPPPGVGWRLVTATYFNGKMYRDWARKVIPNG